MDKTFYKKIETYRVIKLKTTIENNKIDIILIQNFSTRIPGNQDKYM